MQYKNLRNVNIITNWKNECVAFPRKLEIDSLSVVVWSLMFCYKFSLNFWFYPSSFMQVTKFDSKHLNFKESFAEQSCVTSRMASTIFAKLGSGGIFIPSVISTKEHFCLQSVSWSSSGWAKFEFHFSTRIFHNNWLLVESYRNEPSFKICYFSEFGGHGGILWKHIRLACTILLLKYDFIVIS